MARTLVGKIIEFLIGFFLVPLVVGIVGGIALLFIIGSLGLASSEEQFMAYSLIGLWILKGLVILLLLFFRRHIAYGYIAGIILDFFSGFSGLLLGYVS